MSKYTTGEVAKLCGVTVRTVQYYDTRNILTPSELSEGGRRLYSEEDLKRMKIICFLRDMDLPINTIAQLLTDEHPEDVIELLLDQQAGLLREEIDLRQDRLEKLNGLRRELKDVEHFSVEAIGDIAHIMENKKKLRRIRMTMLIVGLGVELIEAATIVLWSMTGIWWPFAVGLVPMIAGGVWVSAYYYRNIGYICPRCHEIFKPRFRETFWAYHTPVARRLRCTKCGQKSMCVETYFKK